MKGDNGGGAERVMDVERMAMQRVQCDCRESRGISKTLWDSLPEYIPNERRSQGMRRKSSRFIRGGLRQRDQNPG